MYTNISPRNNLSILSLAVGTKLGRRRFDTGSNSSSDTPSDLPNGSLTDHRATVTLPKTRPELCHFNGRLDMVSFSSSYSPSDLPNDYLAERLTEQQFSPQL
jgi:hypothetical protein